MDQCLSEPDRPVWPAAQNYKMVRGGVSQLFTLIKSPRKNGLFQTQILYCSIRFHAISFIYFRVWTRYSQFL